MTEVVSDTSALALEQVSRNELVAVKPDTDSLPVTGRLPDQPCQSPEAVHDVALLDHQESVVVPP